MSDVIPQENIPSPVESVQGGLRELQRKDWKQKFQDAGFQGDIERGTKLMTSFVQGEVDVITALEKRKMIGKGYNVPDTTFFSPPSADPEGNQIAQCRTIVTGKEENPKFSQEIQINPAFIGDLTKRDPEEFVKATGDRGDVIQQGALKDIIYQIGMEEAAHSVYKWNNFQKKRDLGSVPSQTVTVAAYDAVPVEYHGLGWRIRGIMDRNDLPEDMKNVMLEPLKKRMKETIQYRQTLKPPKEKSAPIQARNARAQLKAIAEGE